jgi:hypothetical protein
LRFLSQGSLFQQPRHGCMNIATSQPPCLDLDQSHLLKRSELSGELYKMLCGSANHRREPDALIEGYESTFVSNSQCKQIPVRNLFRSQELGVIEDLRIGEAQIVWPKAMVLSCLRRREALKDRNHG